MKLKLALLAAGFAALLPPMWADAASAGAGSVNVVFQNPEKFTDVKSSSMGTDRDRDAILEQIKGFVEQEAANRVPAAHTLTITFRDLDMAGDFEPWRFEARDVRIIKDLYPPRAKVSFRLADASGNVVKEGDRSLSDMAFMMNSTINRNDELRYEKRLIGDWIDSEFARNKKG
ncbi:DUF3016 domain-containing protein [Nibricoccus sp. IMCC34717]|uniref:DUF3016 domain-containing protein n=1 Tax=Nibricoccus sp. IMCC34717 TaxID=3034021 RepID=UPI00384E9A3A